MSMSVEVLNVLFVKQKAKELGFTFRGLSKRIGISTHSGYMMFREGMLPKDQKKKKTVLKELAKILNTEPDKLTTHLVSVDEVN